VTPTFTATPVPPTPVPPSPTATPLTCLGEPGTLETGEIPTDGLPTAYTVYLPPCYAQIPGKRYPVLYLLNGQPFSVDPYPPGEQWIRIGAPKAADKLILSGRSAPFIIVFPEDRYWNLVQGTRFGQYLLNDILPYIDKHYRMLPGREQRAIGGLSRGGGWAFQIVVDNPGLFGSLGLHSAAYFNDDRLAFDRKIRELPPETWPRIFMDIGDNDLERDRNLSLENQLTDFGIPHEWHLNTGAHNEEYWSEHVLEYLEWYTNGFSNQ
jgi:enterochelin esterase-like enzyme